jgi:hypothetical protein
MYADDLTWFDTSAGRLQVLVDRLAFYPTKKVLLFQQKRFDCERPEMCGDGVQDTKNAQFASTD